MIVDFLVRFSVEVARCRSFVASGMHACLVVDLKQVPDGGTTTLVHLVGKVVIPFYGSTVKLKLDSYLKCFRGAVTLCFVFDLLHTHS